MTDELLSLRIVLLSQSSDMGDWFRQAAAAVKAPIEIADADHAAAAGPAFAAGADLAFLDAALPAAELAQAIAAARAAAKPPFTVLLAEKGAVLEGLSADAAALKPESAEHAQRLIERAIRVRLPSRVLVVDDSSTMRSIVRKVLSATRFPFDVSEVAEGKAAIKLAGESEFDIVFLDYNMPAFNGMETLSAFRRDQRHMTVVVMTSTKDEALVERVRAEDAAFLKKPFFPADIEAVLAQHYGLTAFAPPAA